MSRVSLYFWLIWTCLIYVLTNKRKKLPKITISIIVDLLIFLQYGDNPRIITLIKMTCFFLLCMWAYMRALVRLCICAGCVLAYVCVHVCARMCVCMRLPWCSVNAVCVRCICVYQAVCVHLCVCVCECSMHPCMSYILCVRGQARMHVCTCMNACGCLCVCEVCACTYRLSLLTEIAVGKFSYLFSTCTARL